MQITKYNKDWKYWVEKDSFALVWSIPEQAKNVDLPHDAMIEVPARADSPNAGNTGYRDGNIYTYVKHLYVAEADKNTTMMMKFEGVYMNAFVYVNEQLAGSCHYGYSGFTVSLNDYLRYDCENEIRVIVRNNAMTNSRWYSGTGIYRDVYLMTAGLTYFTPDQLRVTTLDLDSDYANLQVSVDLTNRDYKAGTFTVETTFYDAAHTAVASECFPVFMRGQDTKTMTRDMLVPMPKVWSADTPYLYTCAAVIKSGEAVLDEAKVSFGIRTITWDAKRGIRINGKTEKLRGACIHHDSGLLGAATYAGAEYRRVRILKEAGFNAIRMAHNPAAPVLLEACDALGMYVMDETFDMWTRLKSDNDYGMFFTECWEKDVERMIASDYNHPSVIMYSIGNEIPEIGTNHGSAVAHQINGKIKALDKTRPTLASINGVFAAGDQMGRIMGDLMASLKDSDEFSTEGNVNDFMTMLDKHMPWIVRHPAVSEKLDMACANFDIAGYNYMTARYAPDGENYPNRVIVGSETYPPEIAGNWREIKRLPHVIGDFTWTGWDYIGEAGVGIIGYAIGEGGFSATYPCQLAYCGDIDITGFRRPTSYYREIVFGLRQNPYITVQRPDKYGIDPIMKTVWVISDNKSSWNYPGFEGKPVVVEVYAPGDEVELFLNGQSLGKKPAGDAVDYRVLYDITYTPGELKAVAYEKGAVIGEYVLASPVDEGTLKLSVEAEADDLYYVRIANTDAKGVLVDHEECMITAALEGPGCVLGFGSGDPKTEYNYNVTTTKTYQGQAMLIVKKTNHDPVKVMITSNDKQSEIIL